MQKGIRTHKWLYVVVAVLIAIVLVSLCYQFGYLPQKQSGSSSQETAGSGGDLNIGGGPSIFATLSFSNTTGFVTTTHPTSGTIEFVLLPNSMGEFTVAYTSSNNLTTLFFTNPVPSLNVNLSNGTLETGSGLNVTESSLTSLSIHQVVVTYTVTSGGSDGLYVLGLPSTILSTIVDVGTQPYTGPLTWLNGTIY